MTLDYIFKFLSVILCLRGILTMNYQFIVIIFSLDLKTGDNYDGTHILPRKFVDEENFAPPNPNTINIIIVVLLLR